MCAPLLPCRLTSNLVHLADTFWKRKEKAENSDECDEREGPDNGWAAEAAAKKGEMRERREEEAIVCAY